MKIKTNNKKKSLKQNSFKDSIFWRLTGAMFNQISRDGKFASTNFNEGLKRHRDKLIDALLMELSQLNNMTTSMPMIFDKMSKKERKMALNLLVLLERRNVVKPKVELW